MSEVNSLEVYFLISLILISLVARNNEAAIIQNPKLENLDDGFLELKPNGTLILRSTPNNFSNIWQEVMVLKSILNAIRLMTPLHTKNNVNDLNQKIYGDGVEHKFPPFLESVIQRIQTYFSIYKYTDTSQPVWEKTNSTFTKTATATTTSPSSVISGILLKETLNLGENEINVNLGSGNNNNSITVNIDEFKQPLRTSTPITKTTTSTTTILPTFAIDEDEENQFIEVKKSPIV